MFRNHPSLYDGVLGNQYDNHLDHLVLILWNTSLHRMVWLFLSIINKPILVYLINYLFFIRFYVLFKQQIQITRGISLKSGDCAN